MAAYLADVDVSGEWYLPTSDGKCELYVRELGPEDAEPVVVLHGGAGAEHSYLLDAVRPLAETRRVVLYDQRGCLRSPAPMDTVTMESYVDDLDLLRSDLKVESLDLLGHSMGTHVALWFAKLRPGRARRLVLASLPPAFTRMQWADDEDERQLAKDLGERARVFMERPQLLEELDRLGIRKLDPTMHSAKQATHWWRIHFARVNLYDISKWRQMEGGRAFYNDEVGGRIAETVPEEKWDLRPVIAEHPRSVDIIQGDHDFCDFGPTWSKRWFGDLDHVRLTVIPEAGHNPWVDQPDLWSSAIRDALVA